MPLHQARRQLLNVLAITLALSTLSVSPVPAAQQPGKAHRVGFLSASSPSDARSQRFLEAFRQGLRELGWVEGQNIAIEYRWAEGKYDRLPGLAAELVRLKVDVIVAVAVPAIQAAKQAARTIPIVMAVASDPVATGFLASIARPEGNITGLSLMAPDLVGKQMQLLKEVVPKISRVALLWNSANAANAPQFRQAQDAAGALAHWRDYPLSRRLAQASFGIVYYLEKTIWPMGLSPLYHFHHIFDPLTRPYVISGSVALALTAGFFLARKRWPAGLAAWTCYIVLLSPVLGLAQSGTQFVADRYSYLSCLSWALMVGAALLTALRARGTMTDAYKSLLVVTGPAGLILIVLGGLTWQYTLVWRNSETLWKHAIAVNPQSNMAHIYLGNDFRARKKFSEAIEHYERARQIDPDYAEVYYYLARVRADLGQFDLAVEYLRTHIEKAVPAPGPHIDMGIYLSRQGKVDEEISEYRQALRIDPKAAEAYYGLGNALAGRG